MRFTNKNYSSRLTSLLTVALTALLLTSCSEEQTLNSQAGPETVNSPQGGTLTIATRVGNSQETPDRLLRGATSVTVTSARIVIGRIRFVEVDQSASASFRSDLPILLDLDLSGTTHTIGTMSIPAGDYDETRFRIEKLQNLDSAQFADNVGMQELSIRLEGFVNGDTDSTFTWTASFMEDQKTKFDEAFTVEEGGEVTMVFEFDDTNWFTAKDGGTLDPRDTGSSGEVHSQIENNIKAAFKAIAE